MIHPSLIFLFLFLWSSSIWAQKKGIFGPEQVLKIQVFHETNQLTPGLRFGNQDIHPGLMVGTEWKLRQGRSQDLYVGANLGGYHHRLLSSGIFLAGELGYRYRSPIGVFVQASLGLGYLHAFYPGDIYGYDESSNQFEKQANTGRPAALVTGSVALGYALGKGAQAPKIFVAYQYAPELPFSLAGLHQTLGIGMYLYPF